LLLGYFAAPLTRFATAAAMMEEGGSWCGGKEEEFHGHGRRIVPYRIYHKVP